MQISFAAAIRFFKKITAVIPACLIFISAIAQQNKKPPNILIIFSDDHAYQAISA